MDIRNIEYFLHLAKYEHVSATADLLHISQPSLSKHITSLEREIGVGHQAYIICPMVEESESLEAENVTDYSAMLSEELGNGIRVGCLHGNLKQR